MGKQKIVAIIAIVLGAIVFLGCVITGGVILNIAPASLRKSAQLPIIGEKPYYPFVDSRHSDAPALYYEYYIYDIQNAQDIGAATTFDSIPIPVVKEKGPYTYREYCTRHNIYFRDDGATANIAVDYNELCYKEFVPSLSIASDGTQNRESDVVTLPYYQYYGVARTAGVLSNPSGPMLMALSALYNSVLAAFSSYPLAVGAGKMYAPAVDNTSCNMQAPNPTVCSLAAIVTASTGGKTVPNFDLELNAAAVYPGPSDPSYLETYEKLIYCTGATCRSIRMSTCGTGGTDLCLGFFVGIAQQHIAQPDNVTYQGMFTALYGINDFTPGVPSARVRFFLGFFINAAGKFFEKAFEAAGAGFTPADYGSFTANHMFAKKSVRNQILGQAVDAYSAQLGASDNIGSVFSFLECPETFKEHGPDNIAPFNYDKCVLEWKTRPQSNDRYGQKTGRNDINDVEEITMWRSLDHMPKRNAATRSGFWKEKDVKLVGKRHPNFPSASNDLTKWEMNPVVNAGYKALIFNADTLRDVSFTFLKPSSVHGVDTLLFVPELSNVDPRLAASHFEVSEYGVFDLTTPKGVPIHATFVNYMYCIWNGNSDIKKPVLTSPLHERDSVTLDVEPLTGKTIKARFQLLINLKVAAGAKGLSGTEVDPTNKKFVVYPLMRMNKNSQLTQQNAKDLRKAQSLLYNAPKPLLIVGCIVGPLLMVLGIVLLITLKPAAAPETYSSGSAYPAGSTYPADTDADVNAVELSASQVAPDPRQVEA